MNERTKALSGAAVIFLLSILAIYTGFWKFAAAYFTAAYILSFAWLMAIRKANIKRALLESLWLAVTWFGLYDDIPRGNSSKKGRK